jgi:solute carrier family 44 (choline transporter-like protein), member 2/4/5
MSFSGVTSNQVGRNAPRSLTDPCALVVFFVSWGFMLCLATVAFKNGSIARALHGTDYNGNVCTESSLETSFTVPVDWTSRGALWYPIEFNSASGSFDVSNALNLGVCLTSCPRPNAVVLTYGGSPNISAKYTANYNSTLRLGRCIPDLASYQCGGSAVCISLRGSVSAGTELLSKMGVGDFFFGYVTQMSEGWAMIATLTLICIIMCFLWLLVLRRVVKPLVLISAGVFVAMLVAIGSVAVYQRNHAFGNGDEKNWYTFVAVMAFLAAAIFVCVFLYLFKEIMLSCGIVEEATRVISAAPMVMVVPVVQSLMVVVTAVFFVFVAANIYTSQQPQTSAATASGATQTSVVTYEYYQWRGVGQFYNLFMFLWTVGCVHAATTLIVAFVTVQWFWSTPDDNKTTPDDATRWGIWTTFRYHFGTLVFGSFLIAVVQFMRFLLRLAEKHLRKVMQRSDVVTVIVCCAECLLACFERVVKFITKNAYVMTAMTGGPLISSAQKAFKLLLGDVKVLTVDVISDVMIAIGKFAIMAFTVVMGYVWMTKHAAYQDSLQSSGNDADGGENAQNYLVILVTLALIAYFVTSLFASVFHVCVDTMLLSYCLDREINNGTDRPYFSPASLRVFVDDSAARKDVTDGSESQKLINDK